MGLQVQNDKFRVKLCIYMSHGKSKRHSELQAKCGETSLSFARCTTWQTAARTQRSQLQLCHHDVGKKSAEAAQTFTARTSVTFVDCTLSKQRNTMSSQLRGISKTSQLVGCLFEVSAERNASQLSINQQVVVATEATWKKNLTTCSLALVIVTTVKLQKRLLSFLADWSLLADDSSLCHISC